MKVAILILDKGWILNSVFVLRQVLDSKIG